MLVPPFAIAGLMATVNKATARRKRLMESPFAEASMIELF